MDNVLPANIDAAEELLEDSDDGQLIQSLSPFKNLCLEPHPPIARIPAELLLIIFKICATQDPPSSKRAPKLSDASGSEAVVPLGWILVTHVCRHWRQVALDDASIWGRVDFLLGPQWGQEMLIRSKSAPITVVSICTWIRDERMHRLAASLATHLPDHLSHLRALTLRGPQRFFRKILHTLSGAAPLLETIDLAGYGGLDSLPIQAPPTFLSSPRLHSVTLRDIPLSGPFLSTGSLARLHIQGTMGSVSRPWPTITHLLDFLIATPSLKDVLLERCLPQDLSQQLQDDRVATMPCLSRLVLTGRAAAAANILRHIILSPRCNLTLQCVSDDHSSAECSDILALIPRHFPEAALPPQSLEVRDGEYGDVTIRLQTWDLGDPAPITLGSPDRTSSLSFTFSWSMPTTGALFRELRQAHEALGVVEVRQLVLNVDPLDDSGWSVERWSDTFGAYVEVQTLKVTGPDATIALSEALAGARGALFPALRELHVAEVPFGRVHPAQGHLPFFYAFKTILEGLKARGTGLDVLDVSKCEIRRRWVRHIEDVVEVVRWDGYEGRMESGLDSDEDSEDPDVW
ncbi:hypothetical protein BV25DRAFT_1572924 [Artomyces pyxidatus]|uniref:Uncharacterized protein n=1 Tax=Artomyces pyxidatus TaxID=48021 RepID=A0ACB8SJB2_9AGAM|nr:hypothetical protein BV25DRAFT_1572924 [Artomyces pyxidatus]